MSGSPAARFLADRPFSYVCNRCRNCCHDKLIQVNPYEIARLARCLGIDTTAFIRDYLENSVYLRRQADGACVFLGPEGCTVHADRPLVCRLYPLGRHVGPAGEVKYSQMEPHPATKGVYGSDGTAADYIARQGVAPFVDAADRYLALLRRLYHAWRNGPNVPIPGAAPSVEQAEAVPELLDLDRAVASFSTSRGIAEPVGIEQRMQLHLEAVTAWLDGRPSGQA
jgi:Fe-S-cluster containining protein